MSNDAVKKNADTVEKLCVGLSLRQLNRVITTIFNSELASVGMTSSQFNVLTVVGKMQTATPTKIAQILHLEKSSLSRNIDVMRRNGWLDTVGTGRSVQVSMTPEGEKAYLKAFTLWERAQSASVELIGKEAAKTLRSVAKEL